MAERRDGAGDTEDLILGLLLIPVGWIIFVGLWALL